MVIGDSLIEPPDPGESRKVGAFTVECRPACSCCSGSTPTFYIRDGYGEIVGMGKSFRKIAHVWRWQLDPMEAVRRRKDGSVVILDAPQGWPVEDMNAWQRLCWYLARNDLRLGDVAEPITSVHPDLVVARDPPSVTVIPSGRSRPTCDHCGDGMDLDIATVSSYCSDLCKLQSEAEPEPLPPPLPRGDADENGQFSLWSSSE